MEIVLKKLQEIIPYDRNPRKNEKAVNAVAESIRQCGYVAPIIVDEDGVILAGHTRYKALKKLGKAEVQVVVKEGLSGEQKRKYRLLDNKTSELADWDLELLASELDGLDFGALDDMLNWGVEVTPPKVEEDNYDPVLPQQPKSKTGDLYALGRHRLLVGDSTKPEDVAILMEGVLADMLLTDPPYNVDYEGQAGKMANDRMDDDKFRIFLRSAFQNARDSMKPGAAFHIWHGDSEGYNFRGACRDAGLVIRQCLIWVKNQLVIGRQDYQWKHEPCLYGELPVEDVGDEHDPCLYGWKSGAAHHWYKNRKQTTVLQFDKPLVSKEHPTMKPVKLFDYEMQCNSKPGEVVLDLFAGSGTTIIAAEQNGRTAYCMEYDPRYADVIIERWEKITGKRAAQICPGLFSYLVVFLLSGGEHNAEAIDGAGPGAV